jgi:hypothetical protein
MAPMDAPTISIKLKGMQAIQALNGGQLLGGLKLQGGAMLLGIREIEGRGLAMLQNGGGMMRDVEIEGKRMLLLQPSAPAAAAPSVTQGTVAKAAVGTKGASAIAAPAIAPVAPAIAPAAPVIVPTAPAMAPAVPALIPPPTEAVSAMAKGAMMAPAAAKTAVVSSVVAPTIAAAPSAAALSASAPAVGMGSMQGLGSAAKGCVGAKTAVTTAGPIVKAGAAALGWGVALGSLGPWLALGSLGLAVTGVYFYVQARRIVEDAHDFGM